MSGDKPDKNSIIKLENLKKRSEDILINNIYEYWYDRAFDRESSIFRSRITSDEVIISDSDRSLVFQTRIIWTFSRASRYYNRKRYSTMAKSAYDYFMQYFIDQEYGGAFWTLDCNNNPINDRKQIYGLAFVIYALSEYYFAFKDDQALNEALKIFKLIEKHSKDKTNQGYIEAFNRDWSSIEDFRLSEIDSNEPKSNNTHLHIMEAYTSLFNVSGSDNVKDALIYSVEMMTDFIMDSKTYNFGLFYDLQWKLKSEVISCGHEIEGAWLITKALEAIGDESYYDEKISDVKKINENCLSYLENSSGHISMPNEIFVDGKIDRDKIWWVQAEACVGFLNAYQLTDEAVYLDAAIGLWDYIEEYIVDSDQGEWFWFGGDKEEDKINEWKSCYHNSRACIEIIDRINNII